MPDSRSPIYKQVRELRRLSPLANMAFSSRAIRFERFHNSVISDSKKEHSREKSITSSLCDKISKNYHFFQFSQFNDAKVNCSTFRLFLKCSLNCSTFLKKNDVVANIILTSKYAKSLEIPNLLPRSQSSFSDISCKLHIGQLPVWKL